MTNNNNDKLILFNVSVLFELKDATLEDVILIQKTVNRINRHREKIKTQLIDNNKEVILNE